MQVGLCVVHRHPDGDGKGLPAGRALVAIAAAQLGITQAHDEAKDLTKHADTGAASVLRVRTGDVAVFWPEDAHMPALAVKGPALVRKTVVKVPVVA